MRKLHGGLIAAAAMAVIGGIAATSAQNATPYKLGMFEQNGRQFVGMVIQNDTQVVDLSRANIGAPATLKQLIAGWDASIGARSWRRSRAKPGSDRFRSSSSRRCRRFPIRPCCSMPPSTTASTAWR